MTDDEIDFKTTVDELAIIELWDSLPDYCKTQELWEKVKALCPAPLISKLHSPKEKAIKYD